MVFPYQISKHKQWRKEAKKIRRKRLRQAAAQCRDQKLQEEQQKIEKSQNHQKWIKEQEELERQREVEEQNQRKLHELQWEKVEKEAQKQWQELQKKLALAKEEKIKQNMKIKLEWEQEQKKLKEELEKKEKEMEERRILKEKQDREIEEFLESGGNTPDHLKQSVESNSGKPICPFFKKTGTCRFFDACSRNHIRPSVSKIILIKNFYAHYGLEKIKENEHGSDASLEYELDEMFLHYKEFFYDAVSELEKIGKIRQFKTCYNHELHLRGNVYVEYSTTREALLGFKTFNSRWYGGRQLNVEFCNIDSWKMAICGLHYAKRCPKGNNCNFMHVFRNPQNLYTIKEVDSTRSYRSQRSYRQTDRQKWSDSEESDSGNNRNWRWSESPERIGDQKVIKRQNSTRNNRKRDKYLQNSMSRSRSRSNSTSHRKNRRKSRSPFINRSSRKHSHKRSSKHGSNLRSRSRSISRNRSDTQSSKRSNRKIKSNCTSRSVSRSRSRSISRRKSLSKSPKSRSRSTSSSGQSR